MMEYENTIYSAYEANELLSTFYRVYVVSSLNISVDG